MDKEINLGLLNMVDHPAFCVQNDVVIASNILAQQMLIMEGASVATFLQSDYMAYQEYNGGQLFLSVRTAGLVRSTSVTRLGDFDLFLMQDADDILQAFTLAANQLRIPFNDVLLAADRLCAENNLQGDATSGLHKGLNQMHRILCNMSDASRYRQGADAQLEPTDLMSFFDELMEKLAQMVELAGCKLQYTGLQNSFFALADRIMLERAVSNLLTNAIKFSPKGSCIIASLVNNGDTVRFTLLDQGERVTDTPHQNLFNHYRRVSMPEDMRSGLGLGLPLVTSIAYIHGGTALIDFPGERGTRASFTIRKLSQSNTAVRSPIQIPRSDYAGGRDRNLLEFSEVLPKAAYVQPK